VCSNILYAISAIFLHFLTPKTPVQDVKPHQIKNYKIIVIEKPDMICPIQKYTQHQVKKNEGDQKT
jgi:hypothetical protein